MRRLAYGLIAAFIGLIAFPTVQPPQSAAQEPQAATAVITSPADNAQLFGQVTITGSAGHPTAFASYRLEYNDLTDPNAPWLLVQPPVQQQVSDGVLGSWSTNVVPDGVYRLRLRVILQDEQVGGEFVVTGLRIVNSAPTPVPTVATGNDPVPQASPGSGPTPTSLIQQPPSNSPATPEVVIGAADPAGDSSTGGSAASNTGSTTRINTGRVRAAFCSGVYLAIGIFAVMLFYVGLRGRLRPYTRRLLWQIQDEPDNDPY